MLDLSSLPTRLLVISGAWTVYCAAALSQPAWATVSFFVLALVTAAIWVAIAGPAGRWKTVCWLRTGVAAVALIAFLLPRLNARAALLAVPAFLWVLISTLFVLRLQRAGVPGWVPPLVGAIADLWLIGILALLSLDGYFVSGMLLVAGASWLPLVARYRVLVAIGFGVISMAFVIVAHLDWNFDLGRWYLIFAVAFGTTMSAWVRPLPQPVE